MKNKKNQKGQSLTEYLILVALIAVSSIGIIRVLGQTTRVQLANITKGLQGGHVNKVKAVKINESLYSTKDLSNFLNNSSSRGKN
ncbi:MAG: Flp family type IVb pilin [Bdellovibrionales bacterium]